MDALVVAPFFEKSYAIFASPLGMWLPLLSIFAATWLTGLWTLGRGREVRTQPQSADAGADMQF